MMSPTLTVVSPSSTVAFSASVAIVPFHVTLAFGTAETSVVYLSTPCGLAPTVNFLLPSHPALNVVARLKDPTSVHTASYPSRFCCSVYVFPLCVIRRSHGQPLTYVSVATGDVVCPTTTLIAPARIVFVFSVPIAAILFAM